MGGGDIENNEVDKETSELLIIDPKRCRLEQDSGPPLLTAQMTDAIMKNQEGEKTSPKNLFRRVLLCRPAMANDHFELELLRFGFALEDLVPTRCSMSEKPNCIFLCETLSNKKKMEPVREKLGFDGMIVVESIGRSGGLAILWEEANIYAKRIVRKERKHRI